jgi:MGT family glycosyltransferase
MAHFALLAPEAAGHLFPMGSLGKELERRGHRVTLVALGDAAPLARRLELPLFELSEGELPRSRSFRPLLRAAGLAKVRWALELRSRFCRKSELILQQGPRALEELGVDLLLVDQSLPAGGTVAEQLGLPFVTVCSALMWNEEEQVPPHFTGWRWSERRWARARNRMGYAAWEGYMQPALDIIDRARTAWQLKPLDRIINTLSPLAQISQLCPELDFPRRELSATCHRVGPLAASHRAFDERFPWERLDGRPLLFASLGTVRNDRNLPVLRRIAEACAGVDGQLVLSLGRWTDETGSPREGLGRLAGDPLVVDFAPQPALLERAALMITHAGQNSTLEALRHGVPLVALPRSADQPALAARVERAGVGLVGSFSRSTPAQLRALISRILGDDSFRDRARRMQQALAVAGGTPRAADIVELALRTGRPVARGGDGNARPAAEPR